MKGRRWALGIIGAVLVLAGTGGAGLWSNNHAACSTSAGVMVQGANQTVVENCTFDGVVYFIGLGVAALGALLFLGFVLMVALPRGREKGAAGEPEGQRYWAPPPWSGDETSRS